MSDSPFDEVDMPVNNNDDQLDMFGTEQLKGAPATHDDDPFGDQGAHTSATDAHHHDDDDNSHTHHNTDFGFESKNHTNGGGDDDMFGSSTQQQSLGGAFDEVPSEPAIDEETPLSLWEADRKKVLAQRMKSAQEAKEKAAKNAKDEIASFYQQRQEQLQKTMAHNRMDEENMRKDLESLFANGTLWEKVARLVNLQPKSNEERKVGRVRKLLIHLKNERGDQATTVADVDD